MDKKDKQLITQLRKNNKQTLEQLGHKVRLPISNIVRRLKDYEDVFVKRNTVLLNYKVFGYYVHVGFIAETEKIDELKDFLVRNNNVNSVYAVDSDCNFFIEALFQDIKSFNDFNSELKEYCKDVKVLHFVDEIAHENFFIH